MNSLKEIAKVIKKSKSVALFTHINPDFDALGSVFAMYYALKKMGKQAQIFIEEELTKKQKSLLDHKVISNANCIFKDFDTFIACDASEQSRFGKYGDVFNLKNNTVVLDHHICTKYIGKYNHINASLSSNCELIFDLLKTMHLNWDNKVLSMIYLGLATDTASFVNANTNEHSFAVAHEICKHGVDIGMLNQVLFKSIDQKTIEFKTFLWNNYVIDKDCAYVVVDYDTLKGQLGGDLSDCSGFSAKLATIENINYAFSLVEGTPGVYSLSLRSKIGYNVRAIAEKLGGGGHLCAAGAKCKAKSIMGVKRQVLKAIKEQH